MKTINKNTRWNAPVGGWITCAMCGGSGKWWPNKSCPRCKGKGEVQVTADEKMKVGDMVVSLIPGELLEWDEIGNAVVKWEDGTIGYYQENELKVQSGTNARKFNKTGD